MAIKFPTDTINLLEVADTDKLLLADASSSDVSKDIELSILVDYMIDRFQTANVGVPIPTAESQMLVSDGTNNWVLATHFNAGDYAARAFIFQIIHNSTGGPGAPPFAADNAGELAINFDTTAGSQPELWAANGTDWVRANPDLDVEMAYIILAGGTAGDKTGIGAAWDAYTPKPTEPFIIATYGGVPYLNTGNASLDVGWDYLVDPTVAQTATTDAQAAAAAAATSEINAGNSATASELSAVDSAASAAESEGFYNNRSGLEEITEGGNTGLAVVGRVATNYGDIGNYARDLSYSNSASTTRGATGWRSFACGLNTTASGSGSSAEGNTTFAAGSHSHAEGGFTEADGEASHAEGGYTDASGDNSHAEGYGSEASGAKAHAEGYNTLASGDNSHAGGKTTVASGESSHASGDSTTAIGNYSQAGGKDTIAQGHYSFARGLDSLAAGTLTFASGHGVETSTFAVYGCHAIGSYNDKKQTSIFEVGIGLNDAARVNAFEIHLSGAIVTPGLRVTDPHNAGEWWNDSGTLKISAG